MSSAIDKTLVRLNERINNQEFYEAHQAVRTLVARYARKKDFSSAIGMLYNSALLLARACQTGSFVDLLLYMIKLYEEANLPATKTNKGRLAEVAWHIPPEDPVVKQVAKRALEWAGETDQDLSHVFGSLLLRANDLADAEKYLLRGTRNSAVLLAQQHAAYYASVHRMEPRFEALIQFRGVLGYLSIGSIKNASAYLETFPGNNDWATFLSLLIETCRTENAQLYRKLCAHYHPEQQPVEPALRAIEQLFFGIAPTKQFNLMDMFMR